jgi:hypothetical protein
MIKNLSDQTNAYAVEVVRDLEEIIKFSSELGIKLSVDEALKIVELAIRKQELDAQWWKMN